MFQIINDLTKHQDTLPKLVQQSKQLQEQNQQLLEQLRVRGAEVLALRGELRRAEAQRDRLEGLCRVLRVRGGWGCGGWGWDGVGWGWCGVA